MSCCVRFPRERFACKLVQKTVILHSPSVILLCILSSSSKWWPASENLYSISMLLQIFLIILVSSNFLHVSTAEWNAYATPFLKHSTLNQRWYFFPVFMSFRKFLFIYPSSKYWFSPVANWFSSLHCLFFSMHRSTLKLILI